MSFFTITFYVFAAILIFAALRVVTTRNPVFAALWLVLCRHLSGEWAINEQYNYGWFVPFFCAYLFWLRWEDRPEPEGSLPSRSSWHAEAVSRRWLGEGWRSEGESARGATLGSVTGLVQSGHR